MSPKKKKTEKNKEENPKKLEEKATKDEKVEKEIEEETQDLEDIEDFYEPEESTVISKPLVKSVTGVRIYFLFVSMLVGILGGILGELFVNNYFSYYGLDLTHIAKQSDTTTDTGQQVIIFKSEEVNKSDSELKTLVETAGASVVSIFPAKEESEDIWDKMYLPSEQIGNGLILTSDGWLVTTNKVVTNTEDELVVALADKNLFTVTNIIEDEASGAVFLKIEATDLKVIKFGERSSWIPGEPLLVLANSLANGGLKVVASNLEKLNYQSISEGKDLLQSTEKYSKKIALADIVDFEFSGSPVINMTGEIVGLAYGDEQGNTVLPADYFSMSLKNVLSLQEITRPYLGVHYLDLAHVLGLDDNISEGKNAGAVLYGEKGAVTAVEEESPAAKAGLKAGDIITHVNGESVDGRQSLTELVQGYKIGDALDLKVVYQGKERDVEVVLVSE